MSVPKKVVQSDNLSAYKLPKTLDAKLARFDELEAYKAKAGQRPSTCVRLYKTDLLAIDAKVREQSEKKFSIHTVRYRGLPLIAHDSPAPAFGLDAVA
jgi:hypothetical protein